MLNSILGGEVDFGIIVEPDETHLRELHSEVLLTDPFVAVHPHTPGASPLRWKALAGANLILLDQASGSRRLIDQLLSDLRIEHQVVQEVGHVTTGFEMVRAGLGVSIVPGLAMPETGQFNERSWAYWHYRLGLATLEQVPPMPVRKPAFKP